MGGRGRGGRGRGRGGGGRGGVKVAKSPDKKNRQSTSETARFPSYFTKQPLLTAVVLSRNKLYVQVVRFFSWNLQMFQIYVHGIFFVSSTNKLFSPLCDLTLHSLPISWVAFQN